MKNSPTRKTDARRASTGSDLTRAIEIQGLDHVVFCTANLGRMVDFYKEVLGCAIEREAMDGRLIQMRAGNALIDLLDVAAESELAPGQVARNVAHVSLGLNAWA